MPPHRLSSPSTAPPSVPTKSIELCLDLKSKIEEHVRVHNLVQSQTFPCNLPQIKLLPDLHPLERHVFTLVLDLNENLVYSGWKLNSDPSSILYVSGHALESSLQPENCVPVKPWKLEADEQRSYSISAFKVR